jgi:hypothetical protein
MRKLTLVILAILIAMLPTGALAQEGDDHRDGFVLRVSGDFTLPADEQIDAVIVIDGNVNVVGIVHDFVSVINGNAVVSGEVEGDIVIIDGTLTLTSTAVVKDIQLVSSDLVQEPGSTVRGTIDEEADLFWQTGWFVLFGILFLIGLGIALLVVALGFALVAGNQLRDAANAMTGNAWQSIVSGITAVIVLPIVAGVALASIIGFWIGLGILFVLIPVLTVLGLTVSGTWLGVVILNRDRTRTGRPVGEALLGTTLLLVIFAIPGVNVLAGLVFTVWGAGALIFQAIHGMGEDGPGKKAEAMPESVPVSAPPAEPEATRDA